MQWWVRQGFAVMKFPLNEPSINPVDKSGEIGLPMNSYDLIQSIGKYPRRSFIPIPIQIRRSIQYLVFNALRYAIR